MVMVLTQHDVFRWSRRLLLLAAIVFLLCALAADWVGPGGYEIWWTITGLARFLLIAISLLLPVTLCSGFKTSLRTSRKKRSGEIAPTRMEQIMQRLAPDERDYLQEKLDERLVGLGEDGELLSLDDLLDEKRRH